MFNFFKKDYPLEKELWQEFKGVKNTDDVLKQKAKKLAVFVAYLSAEGTKFLFENLENKNDKKYYEIFVEVSIFYLHFIDRMAFQFLDIKQRDIFIDQLFFEVREKISEAYENKLETQVIFYDLFGNMYNDRQSEYGKYKKILPEKNEGMANTLFWEFGKKMANIIKPEIDMILIMSVQEYIVTPAIKVLHIPELLKE